MKSKVLTLLVSLTILLTGCGASSTNNEQPFLKLQASASQIATGRMVTPWLYTSVTNFSYRNLFISDAGTDETTPDLVDTYSISQDGLTYKFILKDELYWSDGEKLTVDDVVFSFKSILVTEQVNSLFKYSFEHIEGAREYANGEADDISGISVHDNILMIELEKPMNTFIPILAQFAILPEHCFENEDVTKIHTSEFWAEPVVSGIYKIGDKVENEYLTYVYNEQYSKNKPAIETLMLRADYELSEVDYTTTSNVAQILSLRSMSEMKEFEVEATYYKYLLFNMNQNGAKQTAVDDIRVRTAIIQAIDFEEIIDEIYYNASITSAVDNKYNDIEIAKHWLSDAEYDFNTPLVLLTPFVDQDATLLMDMIAQCLENVGFQVEIIMGGNLFTDIYDVGVNELSAIADFQWYTEYSPTSDFRKYIFADCSDFDILLDELEAATTEEELEIAYKNIKNESINKVYKFPFMTMTHKAYINKERVELPENLVLGNTRYKFDMNLTNWKIIDK